MSPQPGGAPLGADAGPAIVVGAGPGSGTARALSALTGTEIGSGMPFGAAFTGGVRVASGDINGDGNADVIAASSSGGGLVRVFDGVTMATLAAFAPFGAGFTGGVYVAAGDINGDGRDDVIAGAGPGSGLVRVFSGVTSAEIGSGAPFTSLYRGGVSVAAGDFNNDGRTDIVTAMATGGLVSVYSGVDSAPLGAGFPYGPLFFGGVHVATGDVNGDGRIDIVTAPRTGSGPVQAFSGVDLSMLASFTPYALANGINVAAGDVDGDGRADIITGPGSGVPPRVRVFSGAGGAEIASYFAFDPAFTGGVFVAFAGGPLKFTSSNAATFRTGTAGTFAVRTSGGAGTTITTTSTLPSGITLVDNGNGTATLSGTAAAGAGGVHTLNLVATKGASSVTQTFTLTVEQAPAFTSGASANFTAGTAGSFEITASGFPTPTITMSGSLPAGLSFVGGTGAATISGTPASTGSAVVTLAADNAAGSTTQSLTVTVAPLFVNQAPSFTKGPDQTVLEDAGPRSVPNWATGISAGAGESQNVTFDVTSNNPALFSSGPTVNGTTGDLTFTTAPNANGSATITLAARDDGGVANGGTDTSAPQTFVITVDAVNDAPTFTPGPDQVVAEDSGAHTVNPWATAISAGALDESGQTITFAITGNSNPGLFAIAPQVSPTGVLTFTLAADAFGSATLTLQASDNGGTANGGSNVSTPRTFTISTTNVNDPPSFTKGADQTVLEDAAAQTVAGWATAISSGPGESDTLTFNVTNDNNALFSAQPAVAADGTLTYTLAANQNGAATVTASLGDNGTPPLNSAAQTFTITATPVNDPPSFVKSQDPVNVAEDSGLTTINGWATAISAGPADETTAGQIVTFAVTGNTNPALFAVAPSVSNAGVLTFTVAANASGNATITVAATDTGGVANGGVDQSSQTVVISVGSSNDPPSFTVGADQTVLEDAAPQTVNPWATAISPGPGELDAVSFNVNVTAGASLFSVAPAVAANGTLTYALAANQNGSATINVTLTDDGGTPGVPGDDLTSAPQTFTITVTPVNDAPAFVKGTDPVNVGEDSGLTTIAGWATSISAGPTADEAGQALSFNVTGNTNPALFAIAPAVNALTGDLTFTLATNAFGSATITLTLSDNGGVVNGGDDTSDPQTFVINVAGVNDPPTAVADTGTASEDTALSVLAPGVLANDIDPDLVGDTKLVSAVNGVSGNVGTQITLASGALLTVNANGSYTYNPNGQFEALGAGQTATDTFTYTMQDTAGSPSSATVTITINGVNDVSSLDLDANDDGDGVTVPPATGSNYATTFTEGSPAVFIQDAVDATITDIDSPTLSSITVTLTNLLDPTFEVLDVDLLTGGFNLNFTKNFTTDPSTGVLTISATTPQPLADFVTLLRRVTYRNTDSTPSLTSRVIEFVVNDGAGNSNPATTTVTIVAIPNSPPVANDDANATTEDTVLTVPAGTGVLSNDTDPDASDTKTVVAVTGGTVGAPFTTAKGATLTLNADGSYVYNPTGSAALQALRAGTTDTDSVTYTMQDADAVQDTATLTITITGVNDAPAGTNNTVSTNEDAAYTFTVADFGFSDPIDSPANGLLAVRITTVPSPGTLTLSGAGVSAGQSIPVANIGNLVFTPVAGASGTPYATFTFQVQDDGGTANGGVDLDPSANTMTINVNSVNDAPAGTNATLTTAEDTARSFTAADFGFTDPNDTPANVLAAVVITTLPGTGTLTLSGSGFPAGTEIPAASIPNLAFTPALNGSGTPYTTFTFQVRDNGGTANGGVDLDASANTITFNVTAVNDAPSGTNNTVTTDEDTQFAFTAANFGFADPNDTPPNGLQSVVITTLPAAGSLTLSGAGVSAGAEIPVASITAGNLRFLSALNAFGSPYTTFTFQVRDNGGTLNGGVDLDPSANTMTINVNPVNDAPTVINESFDVIGNTEIRVDGITGGSTPHTTETTANTPATPTLKGVIDNDSDAEGDPIRVTAILNPDNSVCDNTAPFSCTLASGAVVQAEETGEFSYTPGPGDTTDNFKYSVTDTPSFGSPATTVGTASFNFFDMIWYVDADASAGGNGTSSSPFNTFTAGTLSGGGGVGDLDDPDDYIFVHAAAAALSGGIELEGNQHLIGEIAGLSINRNLNGNGAPATLVPAGGGRPVINGGAGVAVAATEALPVEIIGLALSGGNAIDITTDAALTATSMTIFNNVINGATAEGIDVNVNAGTIGTLTLAINGNAWNLAGTHTGNAVDISRAAGTLNLAFSSNTDLVSANAAGAAVVINGGAAANTTITAFANNTIHGNTAGAGVSISNVTFDATPGATVQQVDGDILTVGASGNAVGTSGVTLASVLGNLFFDDLDVFAGTSGLTASGTGAGITLAVVPATPDGSGTSTISALNGAGVDVTSATIDLRLSSLSAATTANTNGLTLNTVAGQFRAPSGSSISKTGGTGTGFSVSGSSATVTYGGTLNVTSGSGVVLATNTGAVNFSGQLTLNTGANPAFSATGPNGTVTATNTASTLATTNATALNVNGPDIGGGGLVFRSIAASGAANGIIVQDTGTTAGLTVSGTGATGSGGTIQNITNRGASFINAINIALTDMNFTNANTTDGGNSDGVIGSNTDENAAIHLQNVTQVDLTDLVIDGTVQHGINGSNVTDLDISNTTIQNTGDEVWESNIYLWDLKGVASTGRTSVFSGLTLTNDSGQFNIWIQNNDGTNDRPGEKDRIEISNSTFTRNGNNPLISDNVSVINSGTGNTQVVVSNATFSSTVTCGSPAFAGACVSDNIQVDAGNNAAFDFDLSTGNVFTSGNAGQSAVNISASGAGQGTFNVRNVSTTVRASQGINVALTTTDAAASLRGTIANNTISTNVANNAGSGINMVLEGAGTMVVDVNNNVINGNGTNDFDFGIRGGARAGTGTAALQINNNSVPSAEVAGVWFFAGNAAAGETSRTCVNFVSNLIDGDPVDSFTDYFVEMYTGTTFQIQGLTGVGTNAANVGNFISATDDDPAAGDPTVDAGSGTTVNYTNAVCATPLVARDGAAMSSVAVTRLLPEHLAPALRAARQVWRASGMSAHEDRRLDTVTVSIGDLPGAYLGEAQEGRIVLDVDAAGWGWLLSPALDKSTTDTRVAETSDGIDLVAALVHEIGHLLGRSHAADAANDDVMNESLPRGSRKLRE
jgi:VCBS repeat-containing protein